MRNFRSCYLPADGTTAADRPGDFGISLWQLFWQGTANPVEKEDSGSRGDNAMRTATFRSGLWDNNASSVTFEGVGLFLPH